MSVSNTLVSNTLVSNTLVSKKNEKDTFGYYSSCFHCNPGRKVSLHPTKALQNAQNPTLDFVHLQPSVHRSVTKGVKEENTLKSFNKTTTQTWDGTTPTPTLYDTLYSKQKSFMYKFNVNILDKYSILKFNSIMKQFMVELSYDPDDKSDVYLFYTQEDVEELYNVHRLRCIYKNKFTLYEDACDNVHLVKNDTTVDATGDDVNLIVNFKKMKI